MAFNARSLDRQIVIERFTFTTDGYGGQVKTWSTLATCWASRRDASDSEKTAAGQTAAFAMSRFVIRFDPVTRTVNAKDRLNYDGDLWNIQGVKEVVDQRNRLLEITAIRPGD